MLANSFEILLIEGVSLREMKDSGIEWIGQIPEDWQVSKVKSAYIVILGKMLSLLQTQNDQTLENYLCAANIKWSGVDTSIQKQMWFSEADKKEYRLREGDVLIMEGGLAGTSCIYKGEMTPCYIQNSVHCCRAKPNYINRFLYYWMNVVYNCGYIDNICNKATIQHYTKEKVMNTPFLLCTESEQEKIASYLDRKCAQIDAIIAKQQQVIDKLKEYKLSVITEAVTKGLDPDVPMKDSGVEWIGMVPEHWVIGKIKNFCNLKTGSTPSTSNPEWFDGTIQWFTPGDFAENYVLKDSTRTISQKAKDDMVAVIVPSNTVMIVGIGATAGKIGYTMVECSCNQQITAISTNKILPKYLMYWMIANTKFLRDTAMFTTLPILNNQTIGNYLVIFPDDKKEEKEVVDYLDSKCDKIEMLIEAKKQEIDRLCRYKKSLIYEVVTGKMEV